MTEPCFVRSTEPKGRRRQFCGRCLTMRRTKSSGIGSPMFSKSRSGRARLLDGHRPTAKSGSLQAQCSRELGQPGSLVTLPPGCLADGTWRANPGLAPLMSGLLIQIRPAWGDEHLGAERSSPRRLPSRQVT
jgi:hypothetical protein